MALLPIVNRIELAVEGEELSCTHRPYLGYSGLGDPCSRKLWYGFRWCFPNTISQRVNRIFEHGHWEEDNIVRDLIKAGIEITDSQEEVVGQSGHVKGHIDGKAHNVPGAEKTVHLFEAKTANDSRFKAYIKVPIDPLGHANDRLRNWSQTYYGQVQSYMGKLNLTRTLFVVTNKNTEHRAYDRIIFDKDWYHMLEEKALTILLAASPPNKIGNGQSTWHECRFCNAKVVCHHGATPERNCRTCDNVSLEDDGVWACEVHGMHLSEDQQRSGCDQYKLMKELCS